MIILGVDAGTQSVKVVAYDTIKKEVLCITQCKLRIITESNGVREQKASWWLDALEQCLYEIPDYIRQKASALGVSGQQHGFVPVAENGSVLFNVKLWCDTSTNKECDEITEAYGGVDNLIKYCGNPILPGYTASKILWFKKNHPALFNKMKYVMLPHDYINYYLTGIPAMERGDASGTGLMNIYSGKWDTQLCNIIDTSLIKKLPKTISMPGKLGTIKKDIAKKYKLNPNLIVSTGGGDNMMAAIGTGSVSDGNLTISLGTSGTLFTSSSKQITDNNLAAFASSHGDFLPLLCTMNCTSTSELIRSLFNMDILEFDSAAQKASIGAGGLFMLPFFNGERVPNLPKGKGTIIGMTPYNITKENYCRATLEGISYGFLLGIESLKKQGLYNSRISLTGGGSNSPVWRQMIADMTGCELCVPEVKESAAFGAALHAYSIAENINLIDIVSNHIKFDAAKKALPDKETNKKYNILYEEWKKYVTALTPFFI